MSFSTAMPRSERNFSVRFDSPFAWSFSTVRTSWELYITAARWRGESFSKSCCVISRTFSSSLSFGISGDTSRIVSTRLSACFIARADDLIGSTLSSSRALAESAAASARSVRPRSDSASNCVSPVSLRRRGRFSFATSVRAVATFFSPSRW